jgi:hypothetical protein
MQSDVSYNSRIFISDGCNSFVFYGGIIDLVFLGLIVAFAVGWLAKTHRERQRLARSKHRELKPNPFLARALQAVVVSEPRHLVAPVVPNSQGLPIVVVIASFVVGIVIFIIIYGHLFPLYSFRQSSPMFIVHHLPMSIAITVWPPPQSAPNSRAGFLLSGAGIDIVNGVYFTPLLPPPSSLPLLPPFFLFVLFSCCPSLIFPRFPCSYKRSPVSTRNNAGVFAQSSQPSVQVFLDISGESFCWAVEVNDRVVYRMQPNPLDPDYVSFPSFEGSWMIVDAIAGNFPGAF